MGAQAVWAILGDGSAAALAWAAELAPLRLEGEVSNGYLLHGPRSAGSSRGVYLWCGLATLTTPLLEPPTNGLRVLLMDLRLHSVLGAYDAILEMALRGRSLAIVLTGTATRPRHVTRAVENVLDALAVAWVSFDEDPPAVLDLIDDLLESLGDD
jgi:hypothetical protein